jgi:hypothetical protein
VRPAAVGDIGPLSLDHGGHGAGHWPVLPHAGVFLVFGAFLWVVALSDLAIPATPRPAATITVERQPLRGVHPSRRGGLLHRGGLWVC